MLARRCPLRLHLSCRTQLAPISHSFRESVSARSKFSACSAKSTTQSAQGHDASGLPRQQLLVPGQILTARCDRLATDGAGICPQGLDMLVERCLPGEQIRAVVTTVKRGSARANKLEVIEPSPFALPAPCQHYGPASKAPQCGGCAFQDLAYSAQLAGKQQLVKHLFLQTAGLDLQPPVLKEIQGCRQHFRYRNKMTFTSSRSCLGLYSLRSEEVIPIHNCHLQDETANAMLQEANSMGLYTHIEALTIRWAQSTQDLSSRSYMAILHVRLPVSARKTAKKQQTQQAKPPSKKLLAAAEQLRSRVPSLASVILRSGATRHEWLNSSANEAVLAGQPHLTQQLCGLQFKVSPASFFQTNPAQAEVLYSLVMAAAALRPTDTVLDLFCGTGTITLALAQQCKAAIGIEASAAAVADAKHNAHANGVGNASFWQADLSNVNAVAGIAAQLPAVDVVVADPARAGLDAAVRRFLAECCARTIVYVSCNPATQARDAAQLCKAGYRVQSVQPCDMFPHTAHVENIVVLSRASEESSQASAFRQNVQ